MHPNQFSSDAFTGTTEGSGEETYLLGVEVTFPLMELPYFPAANYAGTLMLTELIRFALERENVLCQGVGGSGTLNESAFLASVRNLPRAYGALREMLFERCPYLKDVTTFGHFCPSELIWRAAWPRQDAPFGSRLKPDLMIARNVEVRTAANLETRRFTEGLKSLISKLQNERGK